MINNSIDINKQTNTSHLKSQKIPQQMRMEFHVLALGHTLEYGGVIPGNGIPIHKLISMIIRQTNYISIDGKL
jgi:hypothetical protein